METDQFGHRLTESRIEWIGNLRSKLANRDIDTMLWGAHFQFTDTYVECEDCEDFKVGVCKGGVEPMKCFEDSTRLINEQEPRGDTWRGLEIDI